MKTMYKSSSGKPFIYFLGVSMVTFFFISCQKHTSTTEAKTTNCKFFAGLAEGGDNKEADFKAQIADFNKSYMLYQKGEMTASQNDNPYHQTPYHMSIDPLDRPNDMLDSLNRSGHKAGLMIGFGKPIPTENIVTLYLILLKEEFTQIDSNNCKVSFQVVQSDSTPIYYSYNTTTDLWSPIDKSIIDKWVSNLYDADPAHAPVFKGFYVHRPTGKNILMDDYFYVGLKHGTSRDTLNIFSLNRPFKETGKDIQFAYTRFHSSSGHPNVSSSFVSGDSKNIIRACPPYCPQ